MRGERWGHAGVPNLIRMFKPLTKKIILTHFGSWFCRDVAKGNDAIRALACDMHVEIIPAYDGFSINI
jgi:hypothetical protein